MTLCPLVMSKGYPRIMGKLVAITNHCPLPTQLGQNTIEQGEVGIITYLLIIEINFGQIARNDSATGIQAAGRSA